MLSHFVPIFKGKVDPLNPNSCRRLELLVRALSCMRKFGLSFA